MATPAASATATRQIARAAGTVMVAFVLSNLVGLARNMTVIRVFGTSADLDSFYAANRVAELLFNLMAGGALGSAFIPTFTSFLAQEDRKGAWHLASAVANLLIVILILVALLSAVFAPQIVRYGLYVLDPSQNPVQELQTIRLLRILLPSVVIFGLSGLVMGILNAHQVFLVPAIAPAMYSAGWILGVLVFPRSWGIDRLAWGAVLGAGLHLLIQLPNLARLRGRYSFSLGLHNPAVGQVLKLMGPRLFGVAVVQLNFIVNTIIALGLPQGSVSQISQGFALMLMPQMAIAQSIAIAAMPTFSAQVARGRRDEMRASLAASLRGVLLLSIPAMTGLILLRQPVVSLLYQEGECGPDCSQKIAWALLWYAVGLVSHSVVEILARAFYATHDTKTPVIIGTGAMLLNILFSLGLARLFSFIGWMPHGGLALANSIATTLEMIGLTILMRRRLEGLEGSSLFKTIFLSIVAAVGMGLSLWGWMILTAGRSYIIAAGGGVLLGGLVYVLLIILLGAPEARSLLTMLKRRFFPTKIV